MYTQPMSGGRQTGQFSDSELASTSRITIESGPRPAFPRVDLTCMPILESVMGTLPSEILTKHRIIPFSLDREGARMRVACADPSDPAMAVAVTSYLPNISCEYYQADAVVVQTLLNRLVSNESIPEQVKLPDSLQLQKMPVHRADVSPVREEDSEEQMHQVPPQRVVLFATPDGRISKALQAAFQAAKYEARVVRTIDAVVHLLDQAPIEVLFIHESLRSRSESLAHQFDQHARAIAIHYFRSEIDLLLNETDNEFNENLNRKNLHLLRHMLDSQHGPRAAHAATVARMAELVGIRLGLPPRLRASLLSAAFLHNLAEEDIANSSDYSQSDLIALSAGRLASWDYPAGVVELLREMSLLRANTETKDPYTGSFASEILAAVDLFCHEWPDHAVMQPEQLKEVDTQFSEKSKHVISPAIVRALLETVKEQFTSMSRRLFDFVVHICMPQMSLPSEIESPLIRAGFRVELTRSAEDCAQACTRYIPQALLVYHSGRAEEVKDLLLSLALRGVRIDTTPTLLLLNDRVVSEAMPLLNHGIDDILPSTVTAEVLITKLNRIKDRIEDRNRLRVAVLQDLGTHGSLEDMSLVDLLEAMRANRRPVQISLTANSNHLTIVIDQGRVILAECEGHRGIDAVMQGIGWKRGIWSIDPIIPEQLPKTSFSEPVDSILLEACVQMDNITAGH
jgi:DNA-binding response OmpR family regulator